MKSAKRDEGEKRAKKATGADHKSKRDAQRPSPVDIARIFQEVHRTAAHSQRCKKDLLQAGKSDLDGCVSSVCDVMLLILKQMPIITADALKRHYAFLGEVGKAFRDDLQSDELSVRIMRTILPYQNAQDKTVRLAIVSTFDALLKTVDQANASAERQDLYQEVAEYLKCCLHDKVPQVRERAVSAAAAFQTGKKDCDVTQQLLALLCTDTNADVRKQILCAIAPRKEFLEGYFHGMVRSVRDSVARVRTAAWDALGRFPWRYITAYATAKNVSLPDLLRDGLADANGSVYIACRATLTNCWLHRDCKDECSEILSPICCGYVLPSLEPFDVICKELLLYCRKRRPTENVLFPLSLTDVHTASILMWKASCKLASDTEGDGDDDVALLLPLDQFSAVLQDTIYAYAKPDSPMKVVQFRNIEDADNMLRIFLSVFPIYEDCGYLAHTDNTTRNSLLKLLNFLLKVVPDDDPSLFVDVAVRSLKSLTARTPEEASKAVTSALDSLFRSLKLPQRYSVGYDDVEALARKSRDRQEELIRRKVLLRTGGVTQEDYDQLRDEIDRDEKFLLRMQLIVLAFLSHSQRGDPIPTFCSHIIQLGRHLANERVRVTATRSLGLQCLISPETVHTFMPLILADAQERAHSTEESLPHAATGVVFDLLGEYGVHFFNTARAPANVLLNPDDSGEARQQLELHLAEEDVHKVGGAHLLSVLESFLSPEEAEKNAIAVAGFCKLLSCNRLPAGAAPRVLSKLLLHYALCWEERKTDALKAYLLDYLTVFFTSYTASHPRRQEDFAKGGAAAAWALLHKRAAVSSKLLPFVARLADAYTLSQVRDIDPAAAKKVKEQNSAAAAENGDGDGDAGSARGSGEAAASVSSRVAVTRASMQSGRLMRELSRFSTHERIAESLLAAMAADISSTAAMTTCMQALESNMYFYSKEPQRFLQFCAGKVAALLLAAETEDDALAGRFRSWCDGLVQAAAEGERVGAEEEEGMEQAWRELLQRREETVEALENERFLDRFTPAKEVVSPAPASPASPAQRGAGASGPSTSRAGVGSKRTNQQSNSNDNDFFNVDSLVNPSKKARRN